MDILTVKNFCDKTYKQQIKNAVFIDVAHIGWEMDNKACLVTLKNNTKKFLMTTHNKIYEANKQALVDKKCEYEKLLKQTKFVLEKLE